MSGVTLHVSLIDRGAGQAELRYWKDHPNQHTPRWVRSGVGRQAELLDSVTAKR